MRKIWNRLNPSTRLQKKRTMSHINSTEAFRAILERERDRADRYGHKFSLVLFYVGKTQTNDKLATCLVHVLTQRKRSTDELGWFDEKQIGIVLLDTSADGAWKVADDVCQSIEFTTPPPACKVYIYPSRGFPTSNTELKQSSPCPSNDREPESPAHTYTSILQDGVRPAERLEPLLAISLPIWKRAIDIVGGVICLVICSPVLLLISLMIKLVSSGPVFFKQQRMGYQGKRFSCWKFRTMEVDADISVHENYLRKLINSEKEMTKLEHSDDPRIIPFGKMLRQTGLDELPQLINVIRGAMSLIGPRPCIPYEAREYYLWQMRRFDTVPGVTGLWQVSGKNRTTFIEMMRLDLRYIKNRSFPLDINIFVKTFPAITRQINDHFSKGKAEEHETYA